MLYREGKYPFFFFFSSFSPLSADKLKLIQHFTNVRAKGAAAAAAAAGSGNSYSGSVLFAVLSTTVMAPVVGVV